MEITEYLANKRVVFRTGESRLSKRCAKTFDRQYEWPRTKIFLKDSNMTPHTSLTVHYITTTPLRSFLKPEKVNILVVILTRTSTTSLTLTLTLTMFQIPALFKPVIKDSFYTTNAPLFLQTNRPSV